MGLDSQRIDMPEEAINLLKEHIYMLRETQWLHQTKIMLFVESNTGMEASHLEAGFRNLSYIYFFSEKLSGGNMRKGIWTTHNRKLTYAIATTESIHSNAVMYSNRIVVANPALRVDRSVEKVEKYMKDMLHEECSRYQRHVRAPTIAGGSVNATLSGKIGHNGKITSGVNDDLAFSLTGAIGVHHLFMTRNLPGMDNSLLYK